MAKHNYCKATLKSSSACVQNSRISGAGIRKICVFVLMVLIAVMLTACNTAQNAKPPADNNHKDVKKPAVNSKADNIEQAVKEEIDWQEMAANYNPPRIDGLLKAIEKSEIAADGSVNATVDIKREFNKMANAYRFFFLPVVDWYDFESTGEALFYMLFTWTGEFGTFPENAPKYEAEARIRKLFAAKDNEYPRLEHKTYTKLVRYDGKGYSLWPEGYNDNTMVYDLTGLKVRQEGNYTYYIAAADEYQFDASGNYEPGDNEQLMFAKAQDWGLNYPATLAKLLETGEISTAVKRQNYTMEFRVEGDNTTPMIVSVNKLVF